VSGGIKRAVEGVCRKDEGSQSGQKDPATLFFQQMLQHLT
jgi:hypothetical protein